MLLDEKEHWASEIRNRAEEARKAKDLLEAEDIVRLGDVLLIGAFLSRRVLEEAAISKESVDGGGFHFAKKAVKKLILLKDKSVNLNDCWVYDHRNKEPSLQLGANETLSYMDLFSQIIHADPIQLWKSVDPQNPSLWIASKDHISSKKRQRFYGVTWDQLAECFDDVANSMTALPEPNKP